MMLTAFVILAGCQEKQQEEEGVYKNKEMNFQTVLPSWGEDKMSVEVSEREVNGETVQTAKVIYHGEKTDCNPVTFEEMSQETWDSIKAEGGPVGTELGSSNGRVIVLESMQSNPYEEGSADYEVMQTFPEELEKIKDNFAFLS